ncbi:hypothetical protein cypCar_00003346 [Cyprinus carpio]|nr:hypothetical protein cypCar_00003346 [Cyprinus carpio]
MPTSDSTTDEQPINPEHPTEPTDFFSNNDTAALVSSILLMTTSDATTEAQSTTPKLQKDSTHPPSSNNTGLACISVLPPRRGSYYVEHGTGVSVGSMLVFWCKEGYQLVGHEKITCILHAGVPRWSSYLPVCESIPRPNDQGLRIALLVSVVSGVVILVMTVCFIVCCCQERMSKKKEKHRTGRSRILFVFPHRSQESLLRSPHSTNPTYHANSQIYPALVFQRVQTEPNPSTSSTTPVYVQISTPPKNKIPRAATVTHP